MKKVLLLLMIAPMFVFAQNNPDWEYWQINRWEAKDGKAQKFESAVAKKTKEFNNSADTAILTYQIITGTDSGKYMRVVGPKTADFFDQGLSGSAEYEYWVKNVMPYVKDQAGNKRLWRLKGLSYNWNAEDPPKKYVRFRTFRLEQENGRDWFDMMANDAKLKREKGHTGIRGVFALVSGGQWEVYIVEPYDSHGTGLGNFGGEDFDYRDEYNEMFGWRALSYDRIRRDAAVRDYGGEYTETLEFRPEMSTSIE